MRLTWFRRSATPVALLTLVAFYSAALRPTSALAQGGGAARGDGGGVVEGSYDGATMQQLRQHFAETQPEAQAGGGDAAQALPDLDDDMPRDLASLPRGGGAVSPQATALPGGAATSLGMGESFTTQLSTGVAAFGIPINLPSARGGVQPRIDLSYSSAGGPGIAGMGWSIGASAISRQTDRGIPSYEDEADWHPNQDRFLFGGMELVPICTVQPGGYCAAELPLPAGEVMPAWAAGWQYFRARIEGGFLRFFWSADHLTWRVQAKDGTNLELGRPLDGSGYTGGLERNPDRPVEVYRWHLVRQYDSQGQVNGLGDPQPVNVIAYRHRHDGNSVYLSDIYDTPPAADPHTNSLAGYAHHTRLVYQRRPDTTVSFRPGWRTEYALRLARIDVTSKPFEGGAQQRRELVRRYHFSYDPNAHTSLLVAAQMEGRCAQTISEGPDQTLPASQCPRLPPMTLEYQRVPSQSPPLYDNQGLAFEPFDERVRALADSPPHALDEALTDLMDINGDGLPDVLVTAPGLFGGQHGVFFNGGDANQTLRFGTPRAMPVIGGSADAGMLQLSNRNVTTMDLDADGVVNLVHVPQFSPRYSVYNPKRGPSGGWYWDGRDVTTPSREDVKIDFTGRKPDIRVMDVNGDGLVDMVYSSPTEIQTFFALGRYPGGDGRFGHGHWTSATTAELSDDPVTFCAPWSAHPIRFSDPDTHIADMNGDGLADIVRVRSGQIQYWPGRGNGFFGTGDRDDCLADGFAVDRHIVMDDAPHFGSAHPGTLLLNDVNGDGYADMVEIRNQGVDIYLNDNGRGWTRRHIIEDTPFRPSASHYVRLTDIDGSGTPDILWGRAHEYQYIDLTGGVTPHLLTRVHNGLGKTLDLEYKPSTQLMLEAEAAGTPWQSHTPTVTQVLVRSTARDNLERIGRPAGVYTTEYSYRDPVYAGRQREFRGFREAVVRTLGDAHSPTSYQRSVFNLGECRSAADGLPCEPETLWEDNWREAAKGLDVLSETFDENGTYLTTQHTGYELRQLYTGRDGRRVVAPLPTVKQAFLYDTANFQGSATTTDVAELTFALDGIAPPVESRSLRRRSSAGTARVRSRTLYDKFGNVTDEIQEGCVEGCTVRADGSNADQGIITHSDYAVPSGDGSGWLWREERSYVTNSSRDQHREEMRRVYNARGGLTDSFALLHGTLPLDRFHASGATIAPMPADASGGISSSVEVHVQHNAYDALGNVVFTRGSNGRCARKEADPTYAYMPVLAQAYAGPAGADGCGDRVFEHRVTYDRGLETVLTSLSPNGQPSHYVYDGFGRLLSATHVDPENPGVLAQVPSQIFEYRIDLGQPYSIIIARVQDGPDANTPSYVEAWDFIDGLGRTLASLTPADPSAGDRGNWIAAGAVEYSAKGGEFRSHEPWFYSGDPHGYPLQQVASPQTDGDDYQPSAGARSPSASQAYDAFGRVRDGYEHGVHVLHVDHHALSVDLWDAGDLSPGSHAGSYVTVASDGHGRTVRATKRVRVDQSLELHHTFTDYLFTGEAERIIFRRAGSPDVVRWLTYDSFGRMVLNVEPNTSVGFHPDPTTPPEMIRAWRYAYNDAGDMVGVSDARGCGANYHYDTGGRLLAEDRSPCLPHHAVYSPPDLSTGDGTEVFYRYDVPDPDTGHIQDAAGQPFEVDTSLLGGRLVSVSDLGRKSVFSYDARGRTREVATRLVRPAMPATALAERYAPRWYTKQAQFDAADRPLRVTTGATVPELLGVDGTSAMHFAYSRRGALRRVGSSYGTLLAGATLRADGLTQEITLGDAAATQRSYVYNQQKRTQMALTVRANLNLWSEAPAGSTYTPPETPVPLLLEEYHFEYDPLGNITEIVDNRVESEWPDHARPVTRRFEYDGLYRLARADYSYGDSSGAWQSPFEPEHQDPSRTQPNPQISFESRVRHQTYQYDWLGNATSTGDDADGFWDRSLGTIQHGPNPGHGPHQLRAASNRSTATVSGRRGELSASYDAAGNLSDLVVERDGSCMPAGASCWQRFHYDWDEVGQIARARRWDLAAGTEQAAHQQLSEPPPLRPADAELTYAYDGGGDRVLKTAIDAHGIQRHTVYVFGSLELRSTAWDSYAPEPDYVMDARTASLRLSGGGALARVIYSEEDLPTLTSGRQHLFLELTDHIGSTSFIIDHATGELVEYATYQAYGAAESDFRPGRWGEFREPYRFGGKEEDIELGLSYFGARYYSPYLQRWLSPDPVTIHDLEGDTNPYAYVHGTPLMGVDPDGRFAFLAVLIPHIMSVAIPSALFAAPSIIQQASHNGWGHIDWGRNGVAGAVAAGWAGAATGALAGTAAGGPLGAIGGAIVGGAVGAAGAYTASVAVNKNHTWSTSGFLLSVSAGAAGAGLGAGLSSVLPNNWWGGLISGGAGAFTSGGVHAVANGQFDALSMAVSIGTSAAIAAARSGAAAAQASSGAERVQELESHAFIRDLKSGGGGEVQGQPLGGGRPLLAAVVEGYRESTILEAMEVLAYALGLDKALGATFDVLEQALGAPRGFTGGNSRTVKQVKLGKQQARVDIELPSAKSSGNVHVQVKGQGLPGGKVKYNLNSPNDFDMLPKYIRENSTLRDAVHHAFDLLERYVP